MPHLFVSRITHSSPNRRQGATQAQALTTVSETLLTPAQIEEMPVPNPQLAETVRWIKEFLASPHSDLGRSGPVCPWIARSLELDRLWLVVKELDPYAFDETIAMLGEYRELFLRLSGKQGAAVYDAMILVIADPPATEASRLVERIQRVLKPRFVDAGLMIGEFHLHNATPGLHNSAFFPLRSPYPMLAIRHMVASDLSFLTRIGDDPRLRIGFLHSYLHRFPASCPESRSAEACEALRRAQCEL